MKPPYAIRFAGKVWRVIPLACGYLWRLQCGDKQFTVNRDELIQLEHGK